MHSAQKRPVFGSDRLKPGQKAAPQIKCWSHQKELERLIGKEIVLMTRDGIQGGVLLDADQFTLRVRVKTNDISPTEATFTFFKHALLAYGQA